jgi:hypothetical protein
LNLNTIFQVGIWTSMWHFVYNHKIKCLSIISTFNILPIFRSVQFWRMYVWYMSITLR